MTNNMYGGGAEKILHTLLLNLDYKKFDVTLYILHQTIFPEELKDKVEFKYIFGQNIDGKANKWNNFLTKLFNKFKLLVYDNMSPKTFYRLFVKGKYDIEIAFLEGYSTRIVSGSTNPQSKKLGWVHTDLSENHWGKIAYKNFDEEKSCYSKFNKICCVSTVVKNSVDSLFALEDRTKVVYNPINESSILERAQEKLRDIKEKRSFRFISLGRLEKEKGYDRLITLFARFLSEGIDVELWILGQGTEYANLSSLIKEYSLEDKVKLLGFKKNPYVYFKYCDAFVCSSRCEGYSTAVTEALILGMPVVSTMCSGTTELLGINSDYGIVTQNDDSSLYEGMKRILDKDCLSFYQKQSKIRGKSFQLKELMSKLEDAILS